MSEQQIHEAVEEQSEDFATILSLNVQNALGVKAVHITTDGNPIVLAGPNEAGKTSILNAIRAFKGKKFRPDDFIHHGSDKAVLEIQTERWNAKLTVTPKTERLEVRAPDGKSYSSPQAILDAWFGDVAFDPLAFKMLPMSEQVKVISQLADLDFTEINAERKGLYDERTIANREFKALQAKLPDVDPVYPEDLPEQVIPIQALTDELAECDKLEEDYEGLQEQHTLANAAVTDSQQAILEWQEQIKELQRLIQEEQAKLPAMIQRVNDLPELVDTFTERRAKVREKLATLDATNQQIRSRNTHRILNAELDEKANEVARLTRKIEELDVKKTTMISEAKYPIKGLMVDEDVVRYRDIPTDQLSDAESTRVSCAIGMALNPALRVLLIRNWSLLDSKSRAVVLHMAKEQKFQCWVEEVKEMEGGKYPAVGFYIESGRVAAIDGVAVQAPPSPVPGPNTWDVSEDDGREEA